MGKNKRKKAPPAAAAAADAGFNADEPPVESEVAANGDGIPPPSNGDEQPLANRDGEAQLPTSPEAAKGDQLPLDSAAAVNEDGAQPAAPAPTVEASNGDEMPLDSAATVNGNEVPTPTLPPPSVEAAYGGEPIVDSGAAGNGDGIPPPMPTSVEPANGDGDAPPPPPSLELPLDSAAAANEDGVLPPPPFPVEAPAPNSDKTPVDSAAEANGDVIPPPMDSPAVEKADIIGEPMAERGLNDEAPEERPDSSPKPERQAEKLKALNSMLLKEAVETRGQVAALTAQVAERSADADALAGVERDVVQAGLIAPLVAAAGYGTALRGHLVDAQESLQAAKARAAREADAREEAAARLEVAEAENLRFVELSSGKDAEVASASKNVAGFEALVSELAGNSTELCARKGDFEKQLGQMSASARSVLGEKAEVEASFKDYRMNTESYKQEMEDKLGEKSKQLEDLRSSKAEMEVKFRSLEAELSAALARNRELESEMETSNKQLAAAKTELEKLQFQFADVRKNYTALVVEADHLGSEIDKMMATKEAAMSAFATEKSKLEKELDRQTRKVDSIRANKDAAMASAHQKDAEAAKLRAELNGLRDTIAEQHTLCEQLRAKSSSLQGEVDTVQKALGEEKAEGDKLRSRLGELESYIPEKEPEVVVLKTDVLNKRGQIYALNGEVNKLQLAVAEAEQRGKSGKVWTWLCPTTTVIAAASFAYAARSR